MVEQAKHPPIVEALSYRMSKSFNMKIVFYKMSKAWYKEESSGWVSSGNNIAPKQLSGGL